MHAGQQADRREGQQDAHWSAGGQGGRGSRMHAGRQAGRQAGGGAAGHMLVNRQARGGQEYAASHGSQQPTLFIHESDRSSASAGAPSPCQQRVAPPAAGCGPGAVGQASRLGSGAASSAAAPAAASWWAAGAAGWQGACVRRRACPAPRWHGGEGCAGSGVPSTQG